MVNGKPVRAAIYLVVDATRDGANYIVTGVEGVVETAANGTKTMVKDSGSLAKGAGDLAKEAAIEFIRRARGRTLRRRVPDGTIITEGDRHQQSLLYT